MDKVKIPNVKHIFEFCDGTKVEMTVSFKHLRVLESKNPELLKRYYELQSKMSNKGKTTELDAVRMLYVAYLVGDLIKKEEAKEDGKILTDEPLTEDEFFAMCGTDRGEVGKAMTAIFNPKKR